MMFYQKMNYKINKKKVFGLVIVILFLISGIRSVSFIKSQENSNTLKTPKTSTLQFVDTSLGTIYESIDYEFSTVFYDDANYDNIYTDAYLETNHIITNITNNDIIASVDNYFTEYPLNESIVITNGTLISNGTLSTKDADSADIDSTQGGFFNATYTWTDVANGATPPGWSGLGINHCTVIESLDGHHKVVEIDDSDGSWINFQSPLLPDLAGDVIIEWWYRSTDVTEKFYSWIKDDSNILVSLVTQASKLYAYNVGVYTIVLDPAVNNIWYRYKIIIDWSASTYDYYVYNAAGAQLAFANDFGFNNPKTDGIDTIQYQSNRLPFGWKQYIDGLDLSWDPAYSESRNAEALDATVDINVTISGFNPHLSLEALELELYSYYKTNESVNTKFYIYHFEDSHWDLLDDSIHLNFNDIEGVTRQFDAAPVLSEFINSSGDILVRYLCESSSVLTYQFSIDQLGADIWTKLHLTYTRSFEYSGIWKYRWYIVGSDYYSNWTFYDVRDSIPNFEAISESDYTTRWILYSNDTTPIMDFHDDINTNAWILDGISERYFGAFLDESYLFDNNTFNDVWNYNDFHFDTSGESNDALDFAWDGTFFWILDYLDTEVYKYTSAGVYTGIHFDISGETTGALGIVWDDSNFWITDRWSDRVYKYTSAGVYTGTSFSTVAATADPYGIAWDGTFFWITHFVGNGVYKFTSAGVYTGTSFSIGGAPLDPCGIAWDGTHFWLSERDTEEVYKYTSTGVYTGIHFDTSGETTNKLYGIAWDGTDLLVLDENGDEIYKYEKFYDISKNYYGSGYTYMQTNTTELISLLSSTYATNYTLSSGGYLEVDFQTNSDSKIDLILLRNGTIQKTLIISQSGNTDLTKHTAQVIVNEDVEFNQLKISSTFEDTDYVRIYDVKTYNHTITGDSADFYLGSKRSKSIILEPYIYSLSIYEEGIKKVEKVIELIYDTLYQEIYQPIGIIECRVSLFSIDNIYLNFNEFHISINRSLNGEFFVFWLLDDLFYVDRYTNINFTIYDKFDTYIDSFIKLANGFIDLYLEVYSLTLKNLMEKKTTLLLNLTNSYELLSDESIEFILSKGDYQLDWTDELGDQFDILIYLDENQAYELNSSYYEVYFSLFTYDGFGVNHDFVRFYINNARKDFGFNTLKQDTNTLKILDYFNATLFNSNINLKQFTEYNIYIEIYTMIIFNNYSHSIKIAIERNDIEFEQIIDAQFSMPYRMLPNVEYIVSIYYLNGTLLEEREVELDENNKIVPFGFYSEKVPYYPSFDNTSITIVLIILIFIGIISLPTYFAYKYNKRVQSLKLAYARQHTIDRDLMEGASGRSPRMNKIK